MKIPSIGYILIADVGSTTTKCMLVHINGENWTIVGMANVPTTVEKPREDVTLGFTEGVQKLAQQTGIPLLRDGVPAVPALCTSSAGGGLQMLVFGLSGVETGKAVQQVALGAGGVILQAFTIDDRIPDSVKIRRIQELHPDMILMAGGIDGGAISGVIRQSEMLSLAQPAPKFGQSTQIPLVFCGNVEAQVFIREILSKPFDLHIVPNILPAFDKENFGPATEKVHQLFMENVMEQAPGYARLKQWTTAPILPTPAGVERILTLTAESTGNWILMADMGGATTDIFTNAGGAYRRTVAANTGLSYSLANILADAGIDAVMAHLPEGFQAGTVRNYMTNKTLNPTYVPDTPGEMLMERAAAIAGLHLAWQQHCRRNFKKVYQETAGEVLQQLRHFFQPAAATDIIPREPCFSVGSESFQLWQIGMIIGAGGVLSHLEDPMEALRILAEAFQPEGITQMMLDRHFRSPHLGILSTEASDQALNLFLKECLMPVGYVISPRGKIHPGKPVLRWEDSRGQSGVVGGGEIVVLESVSSLRIHLEKNVYLGGSRRTFELETDVPVLIDCRVRGRSTTLPSLIKIPGSPFKLAGLETGALAVGKGCDIRSGGFSVTCSLPYQGELMVKDGDAVDFGTRLGWNRYAPPKLYITDLQRTLGYDRVLTAEELQDGLMVKVGDKVSMGQSLFKAPGRLLSGSTCYPSSVRGEVVRIEPGGLIIFREIQDYDFGPVVVNVAEELGIQAKNLWRCMTVKKGQFLERGRIIAKNVKNIRFSRAPSSGVVKEINRRTGTVTLQYEYAPISLIAAVQGVITRVVPGRSVDIEGCGDVFHGIIGFGPDKYGPLKMIPGPMVPGSDLAGVVVVSRLAVDLPGLQLLAEMQVAGLIASAVDNLAWTEFSGMELGVALTGGENVPFPVILTEGFGQMDMQPAYWDFFQDRAGRSAGVFPQTQIRAGVQRPKVIVVESAEVDSDRSQDLSEVEKLKKM